MYHVISRFVAREWFIEGATERRAYLSLLDRDLRKSDWKCFAYAIMSNHVHLALLAGAMPLAEWLRPMHTAFARWINDRKERVGAVIVRGPNFIEYRPAGVAELLSYIHSNPVRAGVVAEAADCDWTSHRAYLGTSRAPRWLDVKLGLELGRFADGEALDAWMQGVKIGAIDIEDNYLDERDRLRARRQRERAMVEQLADAA